MCTSKTTNESAWTLPTPLQYLASKMSALTGAGTKAENEDPTHLAWNLGNNWFHQHTAHVVRATTHLTQSTRADAPKWKAH